MRVWETLFVLLQLPVWLRLVWRRRVWRGADPLIPVVWLAVAAAVSVLHVLLEGWRWQTVPAWGLFAWGLWLAVQQWRRRFQAQAGLFRRRLGAGGVLLRMVSGLVLLVLLALPWLLPVPRLEPVTGPYPVGTRLYRWTDTSRENLPDRGQADKGRHVLVQLWYPSSAADGGKGEAPYVPGPMLRQLNRALRETVGLPGFVTDYLKLARTDVREESLPAADGKRYPVVVFYHGWPGFGFTYHYLMTGLASRGYVVASIDIGWAEHRSQAPNELDLPAWDRWIDDIWAPDQRFVLDKLAELNRADPEGIWTGRLDLERAAAAGHSFGGDAALAALGQDRRFRAAVSLDGAFYGRSGVRKSPEQRVLRLATAETAQQPDLPRRSGAQLQAAGVAAEQYAGWVKAFAERMQRIEGGQPPLVLRVSSHSSFSDVYLFSPLLRLRDRGPDPYRIHTQTVEAVDRFLAEALR